MGSISMFSLREPAAWALPEDDGSILKLVVADDADDGTEDDADGVAVEIGLATSRCGCCWCKLRRVWSGEEAAGGGGGDSGVLSAGGCEDGVGGGGGDEDDDASGDDGGWYWPGKGIIM
jgi:hypothetical protein